MVIYKTTNLVNGKIYIGKQVRENNNYLGSGLLLQKAIKRYGKCGFKKDILEICSSLEELNEREKYWIKEYKSTDPKLGYNLSDGGTGGKLVEVEGKKGMSYVEYYGEERAKEIKEKLSKSRKGKPKVFVNTTSAEVGRKISQALKGRIVSNESKTKMSASVKAFYQSEDGVQAKQKLRELKKGSTASAETKQKQSAALKGKKPKQLDVHPSTKYWYFYNHANELILESLGNKRVAFATLNTNQRRVDMFDDLNICLDHTLSKDQDYKIFWRRYYS